MIDIINELDKLQIKAYNKSEIPVACIITCNNKIISKAYNKREKSNNILKHAEIIAITKAAKKMKSWKLDNCDMYVTLKPCTMCESVIKQSRIQNVYYYIEKNELKKEYNKTRFVKLEDEKKFVDKMSAFFENKRK